MALFIKFLLLIFLGYLVGQRLVIHLRHVLIRERRKNFLKKTVIIGCEQIAFQDAKNTCVDRLVGVEPRRLGAIIGG